MSVSTNKQPDYTAQTATEYKTAIDDSTAVQKRLAAAFAPHEQATPDMSVRIDSGHVFDGDALTEVAGQDSAIISAPATGDRIDRIVLAAADGSVSVVTGTEDPSPSAPSIPSGKFPCAQVLLTPSTTEITNGDIKDERSRHPDGITATAEEINNLDGIGSNQISSAYGDVFWCSGTAAAIDGQTIASGSADRIWETHVEVPYNAKLLLRRFRGRTGYAGTVWAISTDVNMFSIDYESAEGETDEDAAVVIVDNTNSTFSENWTIAVGIKNVSDTDETFTRGTAGFSMALELR
jgi:hypothetical protein